MLHALLTLAQQGPEPGAGGAAAGGLIMCLFGIIGILVFIFWVWMLIDAIRNPELDSTMRIVWILVIVFTGIIGAIIYFFMGSVRRARPPHRRSAAPPQEQGPPPQQ
jgi:phosphotransferase system  glucose/maltose/N-acetylglucosamine-specific IIC component